MIPSAVWITILALQSFAACPPSGAAYIIPTFNGTAQMLMIGYSADGVNWNTCPNPVYSVLSRDSSLYKDGTGTWWIVNTSYTGGGFDLAYSSNLRAWSVPTQPVPPGSTCPGGSGCQNWAPEWFIDSDGSIHVIISINLSSGTAFQIFETHSSGPPFTSWSPLAAVSTPDQADLIDPFLIKIGSTYYLWFKNGAAQGYIAYAISPTLLGPYTTINTYTSWGYGEGPAVIPIGGTSYRVYFDACTPPPSGTCLQSTGQLYYAVTTNTFATFSTPLPLPTGQQFKHSTPHTYP